VSAADPALRAQRRAEIVAAAGPIIVENGLDGLTFGRLEKALPYTRGVITHHFAGRDAIVDAVLEQALDDVDEATRTDFLESRDIPALREQVHAVLWSKVRGFLAHPEATAILLAFWTRAAHDDRGRRVNRRLFARYRQQVVEAFPAHPDLDALATLMVGTVIGVVLQVQLDSEQVDARRAVDVAATQLAGAWTG
jgi:AcrR family transcriptional regulator